MLYGLGAWRLSTDPAPMLDGVTRAHRAGERCRSATSGAPRSSARSSRTNLALSRRDAAGRQDDLAGITHLVWPEAAMPFLPLEHPEALAAIGDLLAGGDAAPVAGALRLKKPRIRADARGLQQPHGVRRHG